MIILSTSITNVVDDKMMLYIAPLNSALAISIFLFVSFYLKYDSIAIKFQHIIEESINLDKIIDKAQKKINYSNNLQFELRKMQELSLNFVINNTNLLVLNTQLNALDQITLLTKERNIRKSSRNYKSFN